MEINFSSVLTTINIGPQFSGFDLHRTAPSTQKTKRESETVENQLHGTKLKLPRRRKFRMQLGRGIEPCHLLFATTAW